MGSRDTRIYSPRRGLFYDSAFGSVLKFHLRRRPGRRYRGCLCWKALSSEVSLNRGRVGNEGNNPHFSLTDGTYGDIDLEHTTEQSRPRQSVFGRAAFPSFLRGSIPVVLGRYNLGSSFGMRSKQAVISGGVRPRRGHDRGQFFEQFVTGQNDVRSPVRPGGVQLEEAAHPQKAQRIGLVRTDK